MDNPPIPKPIDDQQKGEESIQSSNAKKLENSTTKWMTINKAQFATPTDLSSCTEDICLHLFPDLAGMDALSMGESHDIMISLFPKIDSTIFLISESEKEKIEGHLYGFSAIGNHPTWTIRFISPYKEKIKVGIYKVITQSSDESYGKPFIVNSDLTIEKN